jgi:type I restriction enzyme S subunit
MREVKRLSFPIPPMVKQKKFAKAMADIDKHQHLLEAASRECEGLFLSLQHRAFRGEL